MCMQSSDLPSHVGCLQELWRMCKCPSAVQELGREVLQSQQIICVGMAFLAGLSTMLGALAVLVLPGNRVSPELNAFVLALAGSVMVTMTVLEFWLPLVLGGSWEDVRRVIAFSSLGISVFFLLTLLVPEPDMAGESHTAIADDGVKGPGDKLQAKRWRVALVLMMTLTAHNLPEGFAVAASALESDRLGLVVMLAIAVHNVPEGIAIAVPVLDATGSRWQALWMTLLAGMAEPVGALLALLILGNGELGEDLMADLLCGVGGVMFAVAIAELLPEAFRQKRPGSLSAGLLVGFLIMYVTLEMGI